MRYRRGRRGRSRVAITTLAAFVPALILVGVVLFLTDYTNSPWQVAAVLTSYLLTIVVISFLTEPPLLSERVFAGIAIPLVTMSFYGIGVMAIQHGLGWVVAGVPGVFLLLIVIAVTQPSMLTLSRRLAAWGAALLFIALIYLADITDSWWQIIVVSVVVFVVVLLTVGRFSLRRYTRIFVLRGTFLLTLVAIMASIGLGALSVVSRQGRLLAVLPAFAAYFVIGLTASMSAGRLLLRTRTMLWCIVIILLALIVLVSLILHHAGMWEVWLAAISLAMALLAGFLAYRHHLPVQS